MSDSPNSRLQIDRTPELTDATLVLAFSGWMDGGDVSTGTVRRIIDLVDAEQFAEIETEPFYLYNFPGSMEVASLFRPHIRIEGGLVRSVDMPSNVFYCHEPSNLVLFMGTEPHLGWSSFCDCIFELTRRVNVSRIVFVGSFGGAVPHTREPRVYVTCSTPELLDEMQQYAVGRTGYEGPGSFTTYLMTQAPDVGLEMVSFVVEIPGYLQGTNPMSIEAVSRRLSKMLGMSMDLDELRSAGTKWELDVSTAVEKNEELAETVRKLERQYDDELLEREEAAE
ncbi:MAG: PAC2 family protein [Planctomycetota bacterium]|nr:MAG: PAC2 family protein [Planctomycetota bacterium]REJ87791.1 MAG: PAC2 family protein [Planctomycetota bacterium]REK27875.1 MAG: PAC2 family protein [Planctomycetota bacterium]REK32813.1 MAG: PAC2 family protein [Planctomycetota bacterium]